MVSQTDAGSYAKMRISKYDGWNTLLTKAEYSWPVTTKLKGLHHTPGVIVTKHMNRIYLGVDEDPESPLNE